MQLNADPLMLFRMLSPAWQPALPGARVCYIAMLLLSATLLSALIYVGCYNHPNVADDYKDVLWDNYFRAQANYYLLGGGRYFSFIVISLSPWHWHSLIGYRIACLLLLGAFVWVFIRLVRRWITTYTDAPGIAGTALGLAAVLLMLNNMESLAEGFFWYTGAMTYTLPAVLTAGLLLLFIRLQLRGDAQPAVGAYLSAPLLVAAITGSSEVTMLLCDVLCLAWALYCRRQRWRALRVFNGVMLGMCLLCSVVSVCAPGNALRQGRLAREVMMILPNWIYFTQKLAYHWLLDPFLLLFSLGLLIVFIRYGLKKPVTNLLAAFLLPFAIVYLLSLPGHYAMGNVYVSRITNVIYIFFVLGWVFFVAHLAHYLRLLLLRAGRAASGIRQMMMVAAIIGLLISINTHDLRLSGFFKVIKGLAKGTPQRYSAEMNARYGLIRAGGDHVIVPPLINRMQEVLNSTDLNTDPTNERNVCSARYWHKASIAIYHDTASAQGSTARPAGNN